MKNSNTKVNWEMQKIHSNQKQKKVVKQTNDKVTVNIDLSYIVFMFGMYFLCRHTDWSDSKVLLTIGIFGVLNILGNIIRQLKGEK